MKLYQKNASVVYFGQIDNPYDTFLSTEFVYPTLIGSHGRVLDIGCGAGRNAVALAKMGFTVVGVDNNTVPLHIARTYAKNQGVSNNITFIRKDILRMRPGELGLYDYCICQEVIEHITNYQKVIDVIYGSLKKGGVLILTTQHNPDLWNKLDDYAQHVKRFTKDEIRDALHSFKHVVITITGFPFHRLSHFFYMTWLTIRHENHDTATFMKGSTQMALYTRLLPALMKIDRLFDFTEFGKSIIAIARK